MSIATKKLTSLTAKLLITSKTRITPSTKFSCDVELATSLSVKTLFTPSITSLKFCLVSLWTLSFPGTETPALMRLPTTFTELLSLIIIIKAELSVEQVSRCFSDSCGSFCWWTSLGSHVALPGINTESLNVREDEFEKALMSLRSLATINLSSLASLPSSRFCSDKVRIVTKWDISSTATSTALTTTESLMSFITIVSPKFVKQYTSSSEGRLIRTDGLIPASTGPTLPVLSLSYLLV